MVFKTIAILNNYFKEILRYFIFHFHVEVIIIIELLNHTNREDYKYAGIRQKKGVSTVLSPVYLQVLNPYNLNQKEYSKLSDPCNYVGETDLGITL